jgi:hypothetical protein
MLFKTLKATTVSFLLHESSHGNVLLQKSCTARNLYTEIAEAKIHAFSVSTLLEMSVSFQDLATLISEIVVITTPSTLWSNYKHK